MIKVVLLDIDNTLLDFHKCSRESLEKSLNEFNFEITEEIYDVFTSINNEFWKKVENEEITKEELFGYRWIKIFEELNISIDGQKFEDRFLYHLSTSAQVVDGAIEVLEYLHKKYTLCIASNAPYERQVKRLTLANMIDYFEHIFVSEQMGFEKPSLKFFNYCCDHLKEFDRDEIIMIGDSLNADIQGAINSSIKSCWYNHDKKTYDVLPFNPDYTIDHLKDIMKIL